MIFSIIGFLLLLYSIKHLKKGFLIFLIYDMLLNTNITIVSAPGLPLLSLNTFMLLCYSMLFYIKRKSQRFCQVAFPFKIPFIVLSLSYFLSSVFSLAGLNAELFRMLKVIVENVAIVWMIWKTVEDENDIKFLIEGITVLIFVSCLYGFYEYVIQTNPLADYELSLVQDQSRAIDFTYDNFEIARGFRIKSVFEHAIGAGINWGMYIIMILMMSVIYKMKIPHSRLAFVTTILCFPCIIFTNSRGPLLFFMIGAFSFVNLKSKRFYFFVAILLIALILFSPQLVNYSDTLFSLFDKGAQKEVGGSNLAMRLSQLSACIALFIQKPILGLGLKFNQVLSYSQTRNLLGMESVWFSTLVERGFFGILSNIILISYSVFIIPRKYKSRPAFFISLAYWVTYSATSVPGIKYFMYYFIIIMSIKLSSVYRASQGIYRQRNVE